VNLSILSDSDSDDERSDSDEQLHVADADVKSMELSEDNQPSEELSTHTLHSKYYMNI